VAAAPSSPLAPALTAASPQARRQVPPSDSTSETAAGKRNYWSRSECNTEFGKESRKALVEIKQYRDALVSLDRGGLDNMVPFLLLISFSRPCSLDVFFLSRSFADYYYFC
jgi:hypothetical protein